MHCHKIVFLFEANALDDDSDYIPASGEDSDEEEGLNISQTVRKRLIPRAGPLSSLSPQPKISRTKISRTDSIVSVGVP